MTVTTAARMVATTVAIKPFPLPDLSNIEAGAGEDNREVRAAPFPFSLTPSFSHFFIPNHGRQICLLYRIIP